MLVIVAAVVVAAAAAVVVAATAVVAVAVAGEHQGPGNRGGVMPINPLGWSCQEKNSVPFPDAG